MCSICSCQERYSAKRMAFDSLELVDPVLHNPLEWIQCAQQEQQGPNLFILPVSNTLPPSRSRPCLVSTTPYRAATNIILVDSSAAPYFLCECTHRRRTTYARASASTAKTYHIQHISICFVPCVRGARYAWVWVITSHQSHHQQQTKQKKKWIYTQLVVSNCEIIRN